MPRPTPLFSATAEVERTLEFGGAHVRLEVQPLANGRARVTKAYRKRPGEERFTRAPHLEMTDTLERLGLPADTFPTPEATP